MSEGDHVTLEQFTNDDNGSNVSEAAAVADGDERIAGVVDPTAERYPEAESYIEIAVTQVDYTVEGRGEDEFPVVHVFGRTEQGDAEHVRVLEVEPYFYVPVSEIEDADPTADFDAVLAVRETGPDGEPFESIRGKQVAKIITRTPRDVGQIRDEFDETFEADVLFPNRFLVDRGISSGMRVPARRLDTGTVQVPVEETKPVDVVADLRVNTFDIEVDDRSGFPEDGEEPIICLTSHDSRRDEYVAWHYRAPQAEQDGPEALPSADRIDSTADVDVRKFDSEEAMLEAFIDYIQSTNPDVLTGWNFEDFDAPYLLDRLEVLGLNLERLSRVEEVWRSGWGGPDIKGRVVFDLLYAYQRTKRSELDSYRLDDVGAEELGVGKERYEGDLGDLWETDPGQLLAYNVRDVEICVELDRKLDIISFWNEVRTFVGCKLEDATTPGDAVDMYVLQKVQGDFALPSKGQADAEDYEGGAVFDPIMGVKENVSVLDLKSLYPMCMVTINASPETKVDPDSYDDETYHAPNGTHFRKEPDGVIREMVDELLEERELKKSRRNDFEPNSQDYEQFDRQQQAVKVIMNCFTGDTDVLTPSGVKNIRDLTVGDEVYSLDPETMRMEQKSVIETQAYPDYTSDLIEIETDSIDFSVTPNHRMLVRKDDSNGDSWDSFQFVEAGDLAPSSHYELPTEWAGPNTNPLESIDLTRALEGEFEVWARCDSEEMSIAAELGWLPETREKQGSEKTGYVLSASEFDQHRELLDDQCSAFSVRSESGGNWVPRFYDGEDILELVAWYIAEGSKETSREIHIEEKEDPPTPVNQDRENVITDGGAISDQSDIGNLPSPQSVDSAPTKGRYQIRARILSEWLATTCTGDGRTKRIPAFVYQASPAQQKRFLKTLTTDSGDQAIADWEFRTTSEQLRDDILRLLAHLGTPPRYKEKNGTWHITTARSSANGFELQRSGSHRAAEDGVYCVTVEDNHTLMAGRNGKFQFVGQSLYGVLGWDRFRLYDREMGAAVTATGRDVIEYTESAANDVGYDVTYGDTDSVMLEMGAEASIDSVPKEIRNAHPDASESDLQQIAGAIETGYELEERINESYDEFAREELNAHEHRFEIEFEKLYRRFFQAGKKKRYAGHVVWKEGNHVDEVDITGFEYTRSDIAPITKEVQREVIERIVYGEDISNIEAYLHDVIEDFRAGNVDVEAVGIPGGIGKRLHNYETDTAHVRGAKYANLVLGTNFGRGSKPKRLYLEKVHPDFFEEIDTDELDEAEQQLLTEFRRDPDVICIEYAEQLPSAFTVDWDTMLEKTLKGPIERILEALDISWEEVKAGQTQTGLGNFM